MVEGLEKWGVCILIGRMISSGFSASVEDTPLNDHRFLPKVLSLPSPSVIRSVSSAGSFPARFLNVEPDPDRKLAVAPKLVLAGAPVEESGSVSVSRINPCALV